MYSIAMSATLGLSSHSNVHSIVPFPIRKSPSSLNLASPFVISKDALVSSPCPSKRSILVLFFLILPLKYVDGFCSYLDFSL
jgi:hypothetical protein